MMIVRTRQDLRSLLRGVKDPTHFVVNDRVAKVWLMASMTPVGKRWAFDASVAGDRITTHYCTSEEELFQYMTSFLFGVKVTEGVVYREKVNQGIRPCYVTSKKKTRFRIEYELPKKGDQGAWRKPTFVRDNEWFYLTK